MEGNLHDLNILLSRVDSIIQFPDLDGVEEDDPEVEYDRLP